MAQCGDLSHLKMSEIKVKYNKTLFSGRNGRLTEQKRHNIKYKRTIYKYDFTTRTADPKPMERFNCYK